MVEASFTISVTIISVNGLKSLIKRYCPTRKQETHLKYEHMEELKVQVC